MKKLLPLLLTITTLCVLQSCNSDVLYSESFSLENDQWINKDTIGFTFDVTDTNAVYDLLLDVKHDAAFPNQNCYTLIKTRYPNGKVLNQQVSLELASAQGAWYGDCGSSWCTLYLPIQERAYFNLPGQYNISLQQYNRMDTLKGIRTIGLMVKKIGDRRDTSFVKPQPHKSKKE